MKVSDGSRGFKTLRSVTIVQGLGVEEEQCGGNAQGMMGDMHSGGSETKGTRQRSKSVRIPISHRIQMEIEAIFCKDTGSTLLGQDFRNKHHTVQIHLACKC